MLSRTDIVSVTLEQQSLNEQTARCRGETMAPLRSVDFKTELAAR